MANNNNTVRLLGLIRASLISPHHPRKYEPIITSFQSSRRYTRPSITNWKLHVQRYFHTSNSYTPRNSEPFKRLITGFKSSSSLSSRGYAHPLNTNWKLHVQRYLHMLKSYNLGYELSMGRILGVSAVLGSFLLRPRFAHCMDGDAGSVDDHSSILCESETDDDNPHIRMIFAKRLIVPIALLLIVWTNWNFPVALAVKVIFTFLSTKPNPFSVYIFIEQLQQQYRGQHHKFKSSYAKTVEVEDYKVFSIAKVNIGDQKYTLLGILGGWWVVEMASISLSEFWSRFLEIL